MSLFQTNPFILQEVGEHNYDGDFFLPYHGPKIILCVIQWSLCRDVSTRTTVCCFVVKTLLKYKF